MLKHFESKIIVHFVEKIDEIKIDDLDSALTTNQSDEDDFSSQFNTIR